MRMDVSQKSDTRSKQNLRLEPKIWAAIDRARQRRAGNISRNTWIAEAVLEKLERESAKSLILQQNEESDG
jgi:hypothetical protein